MSGFACGPTPLPPCSTEERRPAAMLLLLDIEAMFGSGKRFSALSGRSGCNSSKKRKRVLVRSADVQEKQKQSPPSEACARKTCDSLTDRAGLSAAAARREERRLRAELHQFVLFAQVVARVVRVGRRRTGRRAARRSRRPPIGRKTLATDDRARYRRLVHVDGHRMAANAERTFHARHCQ